MRHRQAGRKLNRTSSHRKALFQSLCNAIVLHGAIKTTLPKAKSIRPILEKLITRSRVDTTANRRLVFARLRNKVAVGRLFNDIAPLFKERPGGYLRILKCGYRTGDNAPMAYIELVEKPEAELPQVLSATDAAAQIDVG